MSSSPNFLSRGLLLGLTVCSLSAQPREWRSADGTGAFVGELISHDRKQVLIRHKNGRTVTLQLDRLHPDDRAWIAALDAAPKDAIFDTLCFGDTRTAVENKLRASKLVESKFEETFFGRFGLNGTFRTRKPVGTLHCELNFDFTADNKLREITLQTEPQPDSQYPTQLGDTWAQLASLLTRLHGEPLAAAAYPGRKDLREGSFLASHVWRLEHEGTALLGTARQAGKFLVVVRFTTETIKPVPK